MRTSRHDEWWNRVDKEKKRIIRRNEKNGTAGPWNPTAEALHNISPELYGVKT